MSIQKKYPPLSKQKSKRLSFFGPTVKTSPPSSQLGGPRGWPQRRSPFCFPPSPKPFCFYLLPWIAFTCLTKHPSNPAQPSLAKRPLKDEMNEYEKNNDSLKVWGWLSQYLLTSQALSGSKSWQALIRNKYWIEQSFPGREGPMGRGTMDGVGAIHAWSFFVCWDIVYCIIYI